MFQTLVDRVDIIGDDKVGGIAGGAYRIGTVEVGVDGSSGDIDGDEAVGGIYGWSARSVIAISYVADIDINKDDEDEDTVGGVIGEADSDSLSQVYTSLDIENDDDEQGLIGDWGGNTNDKPIAIWTHYDTDKTSSHTFVGVSGKTTDELEEGEASDGSDLTDMDIIYNGWDEDDWDFGSSSQLPELENTP